MPTKRTTFILAIALLLGSTGQVFAQLEGAEDVTSKQLWLDYHTHYFKDENREFFGELGVRFLPETAAWRKYYTRPSMRFTRYNSFDLFAGLGIFYTDNRRTSDQLEIRPWQGIKFRWPVFGAMTFSHYFRLEERITWDTEEWAASLRLRYRISTRVALKRAIDLDQFYIPLSAEIFADVGKNSDVLFRDQGRLIIGLGYVMNGAWVGEFHFIAQASASGSTSDFETSDYILRFQVKHLIMAKDYRRKNEDLPE